MYFGARHSGDGALTGQTNTRSTATRLSRPASGAARPRCAAAQACMLTVQLNALAQVYQTPIHVYQSDSPIVKLGEDSFQGREPLRIVSVRIPLTQPDRAATTARCTASASTTIRSIINPPDRTLSIVLAA